MDKNQLIKYALLAAAGFLAYQWAKKNGYLDWSALTGDGAAPAVGAGTGAGSGTPAAGTGAPATQTPATQTPAATTTRGLMLAAAGISAGNAGTAVYNWDQWGYYYQKARGVNAPDPDTIAGVDRAKNLTIDEWLRATSSHGVSGMSGLLPWQTMPGTVWVS